MLNMHICLNWYTEKESYLFMHWNTLLCETQMGSIYYIHICLEETSKGES